MESYGRYRPFVHVFVPFALLTALANLAAEAGIDLVPSAFGTSRNLAASLAGNLDFARVVYSIWVTFAIAAPGLLVFLRHDLRTAPPAAYRYWQLSWAFGFLAYAIHAYLAVGVWFGWDFAQIARRQTPIVAWSNYLLFATWGVEVAVSLAAGQPRIARLVLHIPVVQRPPLPRRRLHLFRGVPIEP